MASPDLDGGDNSATVATAQLRAFIERIERMEEERAALGADIKEIYAEAKGTGLVPKTIRRIVSLRKDLDAAKAEQTMIALYAEALGMDIFS